MNKTRDSPARFGESRKRVENILDSRLRHGLRQRSRDSLSGVAVFIEMVLIAAHLNAGVILVGQCSVRCSLPLPPPSGISVRACVRACVRVYVSL